MPNNHSSVPFFCFCVLFLVKLQKTLVVRPLKTLRVQQCYTKFRAHVRLYNILLNSWSDHLPPRHPEHLHIENSWPPEHLKMIFITSGLLIKLLGMCYFSVPGPWAFDRKFSGYFFMKSLLTPGLPWKIVRVETEQDITL